MSDVPIRIPAYLEIAGPVIVNFPASYINIHNAELTSFDLEHYFINNIIPLIQRRRLDPTVLGDISTQSIVHYRIGVLPLGQQARVGFRFGLMANAQNDLQIFLGQELKDEFTPSKKDEWTEYERQILVTGDGRTNFDVYFRPARFVRLNNYTVFFKNAKLEPI